MNLSVKILLSMLIAAVVGVVINKFFLDYGFVQNYLIGKYGFFDVVGTMFIKALKMLVVPLVFCSLIGGISGMDDMKALGRTSGKAVVLFVFTTMIAIGFALSFATSFGVGEGFDKTAAETVAVSINEAPSFGQVLINIIPDNILGEMASGNMLAVIFISIIIGISISHSGIEGERISKFIADLNEVIMSLVNIVMNIAPYGVFCLMAKTFAEQGLDVFIPILGYFLTVVAVLLIHYVGTYSGIFFIARLNPFIFLKKMRDTLLFAFSTASSNATLPITMRTAEEKLGVSNSIASFVIPLGATINMNGTAIMQGVATVFVANVYGHDLVFVDYLTIMGMSVLASIGTAGVPGVGLVMLAMVFTQVGLPVEGIALIIGVDRLLDMMRTAVNVTGDAAVTVLVAKTENKLDMDIYNDPKAGAYTPIDINSHEHDHGHKA